jgi:thiol-disulfide isomerase/thioredoxin
VETVAAEQSSGNKVVLFFHAPWCPFCRAANTAFLQRADEIPSGVVVLKTDYDTNTELKRKYGVTYQHTFVQIDANGNQVSKWNGGDIDNLKKYLK